MLGQGRWKEDGGNEEEREDLRIKPKIYGNNDDMYTSFYTFNYIPIRILSFDYDDDAVIWWICLFWGGIYIWTIKGFDD